MNMGKEILLARIRETDWQFSLLHSPGRDSNPPSRSFRIRSPEPMQRSASPSGISDDGGRLTQEEALEWARVEMVKAGCRGVIFAIETATTGAISLTSSMIEEFPFA